VEQLIFSLFRREPPPPPPSKIPGWVQLVTPIIMAIVLGLGAFIGNSFSETIKEIKGQVEKVDEKKVDNTTLQLMIERQEMLIKHQQEEADRQRQEDAKKFDQIQKTQTKTLERIEAVQTQKTAISAPSNMRIKAKPTTEKVALTPEQFEKYMSLKPEVRRKYKQYLESTGKDVSGLPE